MTLLNYTDFVPLPAPLTSGSTTQSYTDPTGEVWVAKNGVNGGNWLRARDVVKSRVYRNAAYTLPTAANVLMTYDTVSKDDYGIWVMGAALAQAPVTGWYRVYGQIQANPQAAGSYLQIATISSAVTYGQNTVYSYGTTGYLNASVHELVYIPSGGNVGFYVRASTASLGCVPGSNTIYATFEYAGSG